MGGRRGGQRFGGPGCGSRAGMKFGLPPYTRVVVRDLAAREVEITFFSILRMEDAMRRLKANGCEVLTINGEPPYDPDELAAALQTLKENGCRTERQAYPFVYVGLASERWGISISIRDILADPIEILNRLKAENDRKAESTSAKATADKLEDEYGK